jgi:hypothetical protein
MVTKRTRQGCTVTTMFTETEEPKGGFPAGTPVEHVTLECTQGLDLSVYRREHQKVWDR